MTSHNIAMALRSAYLSMHRATNSVLSKHKVTADQFVCLVILSESFGLTQQELTKKANSDPNTIRAMLLLLQKRGLITRKDHPEDGRAFIVALTKKGRMLFDKLVEELKPVRDSMLTLFTEEETESLFHFLNRISQELNK
ncbi:MAG: MarR family transcriptional regulator [Melioribacteraceae bacterium]